MRFMKSVIVLISLLVSVVSASADTPKVEDKGKDLYLSYGCALCHGWDGRGDGINGQKLNPKPTNFHDPRTYHYGIDTDSIRRSIQYGIKEDNSIMPAFEHISPQEMKEIISYLQSLQKQGSAFREQR